MNDAQLDEGEIIHEIANLDITDDLDSPIPSPNKTTKKINIFSDELRGYLHKKTKNGKWQKRWFETNGCFLTYYKKEGQKLLAALNLPQVGEIRLLAEHEPEGNSLFTIELNERLYTVKANDREEASIWVEGLKWRQEGGIVGQSPEHKFSTKMAVIRQFQGFRHEAIPNKDGDDEEDGRHEHTGSHTNFSNDNSPTAEISSIRPNGSQLTNRFHDLHTEMTNGFPELNTDITNEFPDLNKDKSISKATRTPRRMDDHENKSLIPCMPCCGVQ